MGRDRRIDADRRIDRDRRLGNSFNVYNGPERRRIFDRRDYSERRITSYKVKLNWILGLATAFLGIIGTSGGLVVLNRKLKQKKNENV